MAPQPLSAYPRPPHDNGRGIHWSASIYHPTGADLQYWIDELKAMQIKWLKVLDDGGGSSLELCRALIDNDIMPVVRLYRPQPNPGHIGGREIDTVERLVAAGVRYFETNNEPDLPSEWQNNHRPHNWLDIVADNFIIDADLIQARGGLPAFPAVGPGADNNGIAKVVAKGRIDIFEKGAWLAIHNYTLSHPLDYPYDAVNQEGRPLTPEEYQRLAAWQYSHLSWEEIQQKGIAISREDYDKFNRWAWDGRSIEQINEVRAKHKNPGDTIFDDANCFRAWEFWGQIVYETLGFHIPIISTEGGPVTGWGDDDRYAKVNPTTQAEWQMAITQFMQDEAPPWYFTVCTWLLASKPLGDFNPTWDQMSWYTHAWDLQFGLDGTLPIVQQLKDTPAKIRHELRPSTNTTAVMGVVLDSSGQSLAGVQVELRNKAGDIVAHDVSDEAGRFELRADAGVYDLFVPWLGVVAHDVTLNSGDVDVIDVRNVDTPGTYEVRGQMMDNEGLTRPGAKVHIQRNGIVHASTQTDAMGQFSFRPALAGEYILVADGVTATVSVSAAEPTITQNLIVAAPETYRYRVVEKRLLSKEETGNREMFYGTVTNEKGEELYGVELEMRWQNADPDTHFPRTTTGHDPFKPKGYYEFLHTKGNFMIQVVQGDYKSDVADDLETAHVPGREGDRITYEVNFQLLPVDNEKSESVIKGSIPGGRVGQAVQLWRDEQIVAKSVLDSARNFRFEQLAAGVYEVELAGVGIIRTDIVMNGEDEVDFSFPLMGAIVGKVEGGDDEQNVIKLISETYGFTRHSELTADGQYRFTNLPAGDYRLELNDNILSGLHSDGQSVLEAPTLQIEGSVQAQDSKIVGQVHDANHHPTPNVTVQLLLQEEIQATATTDAKGRYSFTDLGPGIYAVVAGANVRVDDIVLDGKNQVTVDLLYAPVVEAPSKRLHRYYLLNMQDRDLLPALTRLTTSWLQTQPAGAVGYSITEAQYADTVILLGDGLPASVIALLQDAKCEIIDMRGDLLTLAKQV